VESGRRDITRGVYRYSSAKPYIKPKSLEEYNHQEIAESIPGYGDVYFEDTGEADF
jgi:hypothetical protein